MISNMISSAVLTIFLTSAACAQSWAQTVPNCLTRQGQMGDLRHNPKMIWDVFVNGKFVGSERHPGIANQLMKELDASK